MSAGDILKEEHLQNVTPNTSERRIKNLYPHLVAAMDKYKINNKMRVAHFVGQLMWETGEFRYLEEAGFLPQPERRNYQKTLRYYPYHGRGAIQLTWRENYAAYSKARGVDFVTSPDLVRRFPFAFDAAGWFWNSRGLSKLADDDNTWEITRLIWGAANADAVAKRGAYVNAVWRQINEAKHDNSRFRLGMDYVKRGIVNNREYWIWGSGIVPAGEGMYAINKPLPHPSKIGRLNCAGLTNLFFRAAGKRIPTRGNPNYDGGVAAYAGGVYGPGYFEGYSEPFNLATAKRWAKDTDSGVLLLRPFWNNSLAGQGHVAILLPSGYVLQSFIDINGPDCNWNYTIEESHAGYYYTDMVHPINWIDYEGDEVFAV